MNDHDDFFPEVPTTIETAKNYFVRGIENVISVMKQDIKRKYESETKFLDKLVFLVFLSIDGDSYPFFGYSLVNTKNNEDRIDWLHELYVAKTTLTKEKAAFFNDIRRKEEEVLKLQCKTKEQKIFIMIRKILETIDGDNPLNIRYELQLGKNNEIRFKDLTSLIFKKDIE
jgi:hypothetical protein